MIDANMITPDQFTSVGTAWIDAFAVVVGHFLSQTGMIVAAVYGLVKAVQTGAASLKELQAQQDAQGARIEAMEKGHSLRYARSRAACAVRRSASRVKRKKAYFVTLTK